MWRRLWAATLPRCTVSVSREFPVVRRGMAAACPSEDSITLPFTLDRPTGSVQARGLACRSFSLRQRASSACKYHLSCFLSALPIFQTPDYLAVLERLTIDAFV